MTVIEMAHDLAPPSTLERLGKVIKETCIRIRDETSCTRWYVIDWFAHTPRSHSSKHPSDSDIGAQVAMFLTIDKPSSTKPLSSSWRIHYIGQLLVELYKEKRVDLSFHAVVIERPWCHELFTAEALDKMREELRRFDYRVKVI